MKHFIKIFVFFTFMNTYAQNDEIFIQPIIADKAYQNVYGSTTLQIDDAGNDGLITKPLIIVEGLDTGLQAQAGSIGDSDLRTLIRNIEDAESDNLSDLLTGGNILANGDQDYDIIYVNWDNGTDFIQRNAYVLEAVIKWVNDNKTGTNKNVVLGQSMGGLIARYALRDMENTGLSHDTSLYISHDAPHQGAHLPLGILYMARDVVNQFIQTPLGDISIPVEGGGNVGLGTIDDLLDAPAVNQMLINTVDTNGNRTNTVHTNWQNELRNFGYPLQTRNIALSNASHCASNQGLISNQELVTAVGNGGTSDLTSLLMFTMLPVDQLIGEALDDVSASLLGFLPGNSSLDLEFRVNAFPSSGTARIYKGRLTKTFLWVLPITRTIFDNSQNSQSGDKFIDNYPGGVTPNALAISEGTSSNNWFYNYDYGLNVNLNFNFISATSALDVGSGSALLTEIDYFKIYTAASPPTGSKTIPFVNFSTSSNQNNSLNAPHISFNRRNGDWLATELDAVANNNQIFDCSYICSTREPNWSNSICTSQVFTSPVIRPDATYIWSINGEHNLVTGSVTNLPNFTITNKNIGSGYITLDLFITTPACGTRNYTKRIWVGLPIIRQPLDCATNPINDPSCSLTLCKSYEYLVNNLIRIEAVGMDQNSTYTDWEWVKISNNFNWNTVGANGSIRIQAPQTGPVVFKVRAKNACGWTPWLIQNYTVVNCPGPIASRMASETIYTVYPNPASDVVNISLRDENNIPSTDTAVSGELVDMNGQTQATVQISNNQATFSVAGLPMGVYILNINVNGLVEAHQIAVE